MEEKGLVGPQYTRLNASSDFLCWGCYHRSLSLLPSSHVLQPPAPVQLLTRAQGRWGPLAGKSWSLIRLRTQHHYSGAQELQGGLREGS